MVLQESCNLKQQYSGKNLQAELQLEYLGSLGRGLATYSRNVTHAILQVQTASCNVMYAMLHLRTASCNVTHAILQVQTASCNVTHAMLHLQTGSCNVTHAILQVRTVPVTLRMRSIVHCQIVS